LLTTLLLPLLGAAVDVQAVRIVVLQASDSPRLSQTFAAMQKSTGEPLEVFHLANASETVWQATLASGERPAVIVALGPRASDFMIRVPQPSPVVHCLAGADALRAGLPSLPSEVPADAQAAWLRKLLPAARTVGLAFDPATNTRRAEAIAATLTAAGYKTLMAPVAKPSALPAALETVATRADVLFALPDPMVYTRASARGILLQSFRTRTPVIGPNEFWVKEGALFAVDWDYDEVGAICARLARDAQASRPALLPSAANAAPRPRIAVNLRIASQFGLQWHADLLRSVDVRHE
jgi:putative ABC transport system substrate-binding protein